MIGFPVKSHFVVVSSDSHLHLLIRISLKCYIRSLSQSHVDKEVRPHQPCDSMFSSRQQL
ncbi:hypothetical protein V2J09_002878 [Rumex salicifolius]